MEQQQSSTHPRAFYFSLLIHTFCIIGLYSDLPILKKKPNEPIMLTFETLPISVIPNIKIEESPNRKAAESQVIQSQVQQKQASQQEQALEPSEQKTNTQEDKPKDDIKIPQSQPQQSNATHSTIKSNETLKIEEHQQKAVAAAPKNKSDKNQNNPDTVMKNLQHTSTDKTKETASKSKKTHAMSSAHNKQLPLSTTEELILRRKIERNWRPPVGNAKLASIRVLIRIELQEDGTIKSLSSKVQSCPILAGTTCELVQESAIRAVKNAAPFTELSRQRYHSWKEIEFYFDPSQISE